MARRSGEGSNRYSNKTSNGKDAVGIDDSHREILTTNAAPKIESKNLEYNTKITFEEQELEPVIRKKLLNKVAQHKFNQDIYDASIISYKVLHNYEDLVWLMKKFDIHHPLMDDVIDLLEKDTFYLKMISAALGVSMFYFSGDLAIPYSVLSNFEHKECGLVGSITTKIGEALGYENLCAKYCNEVAGADLVISSSLVDMEDMDCHFLYIVLVI